MAISKVTAEKLVKDMCAGGVSAILTGWNHAVSGHYNFQDPTKPEESGKSYFTVGAGQSGMAQTNAMVGLLGKVIGTQTNLPEMRGDDGDDGKVYIYRSFAEVIGKSGAGADCNIVRIVLTRQAAGRDKGKPVMKTTYPDTRISGAVLK